MVQYHAKRNSTEPGPFHDDSEQRCTGGRECNRKHDSLATVCGRNGHDLFGNQTLDVLEYLKGVSRKYEWLEELAKTKRLSITCSPSDGDR
jgi:hypothetical protein